MSVTEKAVSPAEKGLARKQREFNVAMARYAQAPIYRRVGQIVSAMNVGGQAILGVLAFAQPIGFVGHLLAALAAYVLADLVNGWVHLYMDNHDDYVSAVGPLVASFHLHHRTPVYRQRPWPLVYYQESGTKLWLAALTSLVVAAGLGGGLRGAVLAGFFYFAVFSSLAEVAHYLCHVPQTRLGQFLSRLGLLLSKQHHGQHHLQDNVSYAFLNGMTDPLLNLLAKAFYPGYKQTTDLHYAAYQGDDTANRKP